MTTKIGIIGYGNIGRGVHQAILLNARIFGDVSLGGIITRRPDDVRREQPGVTIVGLDTSLEIDVAILCGGSATDLPRQGPALLSRYNTVDSFDTHARIPEYFAQMDEAAKAAGHVAVIAAGWDPGTFSLERALADAFLPGAHPVGFYGVAASGGLSMGHSDAIRRVEGVEDARQYTHAIPSAIERARRGEPLTPGEMHWRECFVVARDGADKDRIAREIKAMPHYFAPYETSVAFIDADELREKHGGMPHDGMVVATATTAGGARGVIEYGNRWDSNPAATAGILVAYARAADRLRRDGRCGAFTVLDIPPAYVSPRSRARLLDEFV